MGSSVEETVVRKSVLVRATVERAFSVFVEQMETWWPATHHMAKDAFELIVVEPRVGGRWYERDANGVEGDWGTVLLWDPPHLVRLSWHVAPSESSEEWKYDPDPQRASEVQIRFVQAANGMTLVELEHSKLERHGGNTQLLRTVFDGPGAWEGMLALFAKKLDERDE